MTQYARRDPCALDQLGGYHCRHISAMTEEGLHSKAAIAAELAWRDAEIDRLRAEARAAYLAMAEECERRARGAEEDLRDEERDREQTGVGSDGFDEAWDTAQRTEARVCRDLAAWARGRAGK